MHDHTKPQENAPNSTAKVREHELSSLIGYVLRYGVLISATLILIGYVLLVQTGLPTRHFEHFTGVATPGAYGLLDVFMRVRNRHSPDDIITLGLIALILTPVVRVGMSWVIFLYERDRLYAWLTATVFAILVFSLMGGSL